MSATKPRVSLADFLRQCPEDPRVEWAAGEVIEQVPPLTRHQQVAHFLSILLAFYAELTDGGLVLVAPYLMLLSPEGPAREPDVLLVRKKHASRVLWDRLDGPADLVIDVISEDSVRRDRADKFDEYEQFGVREYWLIDARPGREREDCWVLDEHGKYQATAKSSDGVVASTVLPGFWLRPQWLRADPLPSALATLAEIAGPEGLARALRPMDGGPGKGRGGSGTRRSARCMPIAWQSVDLLPATARRIPRSSDLSDALFRPSGCAGDPAVIGAPVGRGDGAASIPSPFEGQTVRRARCTAAGTPSRSGPAGGAVAPLPRPRWCCTDEGPPPPSATAGRAAKARPR